MKYRKRPIEVEAEQFLSLAWHQRTPHSEGSPLNAICVAKDRTTAEIRAEEDGPQPFTPLPHVHTLEGFLTVSDGDWIVRGIQGEHYPVKPDIFQYTYERGNVHTLDVAMLLDELAEFLDHMRCDNDQDNDKRVSLILSARAMIRAIEDTEHP